MMTPDARYDNFYEPGTLYANEMFTWLVFTCIGRGVDLGLTVRGFDLSFVRVDIRIHKRFDNERVLA